MRQAVVLSANYILNDQLPAKALKIPGCPTRVYYLRASVRRLNGDKAGADEDLARCFKETPTNDVDWMTRGRAKVDTDPQGALADLNKALELNLELRSYIKQHTPK